MGSELAWRKLKRRWLHSGTWWELFLTALTCGQVAHQAAVGEEAAEQRDTYSGDTGLARQDCSLLLTGHIMPGTSQLTEGMAESERLTK